MTLVLFSLYYTQPGASKHAVSVRGAPTLVLTIRRSKTAVSPLELHSNRPNLNFLPVGYGFHQRTIIIYIQQSEKGGGKHCDLAHMYL